MYFNILFKNWLSKLVVIAWQNHLLEDWNNCEQNARKLPACNKSMLTFFHVAAADHWRNIYFPIFCLNRWRLSEKRDLFTSNLDQKYVFTQYSGNNWCSTRYHFCMTVRYLDIWLLPTKSNIRKDVRREDS